MSFTLANSAKQFNVTRASTSPVLLAMLFMAFLATSTAAQNSALERLPKQQAIYLWTGDFPRLLQQIQRAAIPGEEFTEALDRYVGSQSEQPEIGNEVVQQLKMHLLQVQQASELWSRLTDEQLFTGEATLILPVDFDWKIPSRQSGSNQPKITKFAFVARTHGSQEEINELFREIARCVSPTNDEEERRAQDRELLDVPGVWQLENGWLCWASDEAIADSILDHLQQRSHTKDTLVADRSFEATMGHLNSRHQSQYSLSIYATERALPFLVWNLAEGSQVLDFVRRLDWRLLYLDELRGLGARFYLPDEDLEKSLSYLFAVDAFLQITSPRRGVSDALDSNRDNQVEYDLPMLAAPLESFIQFALDGEKLHTGLVEIYERASALSPALRETNETREAPPEFELARHIARLCEVRFHLDKSAINGQGRDDGYIMAIAPDDSESLVAVLETKMNPSLSKLSPDQLEGPLRQIPDDEIVAFSISRSSTDRFRQIYQEYIRELEERIRQSENSIEPGALAKIELLRDDVVAYQFLLNQIDQRATQIQSLQFEDWFLAEGLNNEHNQQLLVDGYGRSHDQLVELEQQVEALLEMFGNRRSPVGLFAYWASGLIEQGRMLASRKPAPAFRLRGGRPEQPKPQSNPMEDFLAKQLSHRIDKLLALITTDDDGFRIQGALLRPEPLDEEVDE